jgi:hypothetical protein
MSKKSPVVADEKEQLILEEDDFFAQSSMLAAGRKIPRCPNASINHLRLMIDKPLGIGVDSPREPPSPE